MAGSSNFLQFNPGQVNQEDDAAWAADAQRAGGLGQGQAVPSVMLNKALYQLSTFVTAFGLMLAGKNFNVSDANVNTLAAVLANLLTSNDQLPLITPVGFSSTPNFNAAVATGFQITLSGNITSSSIAGVTAGQLYAFYFVQDGNGGHTIAMPPGVPTIQPDPAPNALSLVLYRADVSGTLQLASPMSSYELTTMLALKVGPIAAGAITAASINAAAIIAGLGFTPVQQGTGVGQGNNAIKLGWSGNRLLATVDLTDQGAITTDSSLQSPPVIGANAPNLVYTPTAANGTASLLAASTQFVANAIAAIPPPVAHVRQVYDLTGQRQIGVQYVNNTGFEMAVSGHCIVQGGSGDSQVVITVNGIPGYGSTITGTIAGERGGFVAPVVPPGATYIVNTSGRLLAVGSWSEAY